jgi:hypothetical protein
MADGLDRGLQPQTRRRELCNLAIALHRPLFERLNLLTRPPVDHSRQKVSDVINKTKSESF